MSLRQRQSGSAGRGSQKVSGLHVLDDEERVLNANTEINKLNAENDKLQALYEAANKKLSEANRAVHQLKEQGLAMKDDNQIQRAIIQKQKEELERSNQERDRAKYEIAGWEKNYIELKTRYEHLLLNYNAVAAPSPTNPMAAPLPERPKVSRTASKREPREPRDQRDDRGRTRDREKREQKEIKAEKERLSRRFDDRRPPTNNRRGSFIEGWGPGPRSSSANPAGRSFQTVATGQRQNPAFTQAQQAAYSNIPRTTNPMSPGLYSSSGSSAVYDDDIEDGNYHPYPIR